MRNKILENKQAHDRIAAKYESRHPEIYNEIEQSRLHDALKSAVKEIKTDSKSKTVLDFGCGAGNLTKHLMELDLAVVSADISKKFLEMIEDRFIEIDRSRTMLLNGEDLSNVEDNKYDLVATYSVLHHVPDYLKIVEEFARVVKPGGVIYIDHEVNENYWKRPKELVEFYASQQVEKKSLLRFLNPKTYTRKLRSLINPRFQEEGDVHVWPDDHIDWGKIKNRLTALGCEIIREEDFLHYNKLYNKNDWEYFRNKTTDMKFMVARKKQ